MTVVIDTNVLLQMLSTRHSFHVILEAWSKGQFTWALSNESLLEYEELAVPRVGLLRWREFMKAMELVDTIHRNVRHISPTFRFHLPHSDPDDQKFADCAIAAEADYIITSDHHFDALRDSGYKPQPITPKEFIQRHLQP